MVDSKEVDHGTLNDYVNLYTGKYDFIIYLNKYTPFNYRMLEW